MPPYISTLQPGYAAHDMRVRQSGSLRRACPCAGTSFHVSTRVRERYLYKTITSKHLKLARLPRRRHRMGRSRAALPRPSVGRAERSLSRPLQAALDRDVFEDDDVSRGRRKHALHGENEEEAGSEYGEMEGSDEEVTSDEDGDEVGGRRGARDDLESLGSSVDPDEVTDLSRMLSDDEDDSGVSDGDAYSSAAANAGMLQAVGLRASRSRQNRERTEGLEESEQAVPDAPHLSVDDLLGSLGEQDSVSLLRRDLRGVAKGGARRSAHAQLAAPVEQATKRRLERQAAAEAAHRIVSGWEQAVHRSTTAETLRFPQASC